MKKGNLKNIESSGFKTSDGYFDDLESSILNNIKSQDKLNSIKETGMSVPDGYFEELDERLVNVANPNKSGKVRSLINFKNIAYISGIAASILLIINFMIENHDSLKFSDLNYATIESYIDSEDLNTYDLAQYLELEETNLQAYTEDNFDEETLEAYLIDNVSTEDFLNEQN